MANHKNFILSFKQEHSSCVLASYCFALEYFIRQNNPKIALGDSFVNDFFHFYCKNMFDYWRSSSTIQSAIEKITDEKLKNQFLSYLSNPELVASVNGKELESLVFIILHYQCQELDKRIKHRSSSGYENIKFIHEKQRSGASIGDVPFPDNIEVIDMCCGPECAPDKKKLKKELKETDDCVALILYKLSNNPSNFHSVLVCYDRGYYYIRDSGNNSVTHKTHDGFSFSDIEIKEYITFRLKK